MAAIGIAAFQKHVVSPLLIAPADHKMSTWHTYRILDSMLAALFWRLSS